LTLAFLDASASTFEISSVNFDTFDTTHFPSDRSLIQLLTDPVPLEYTSKLLARDVHCMVVGQ